MASPTEITVSHTCSCVCVGTEGKSNWLNEAKLREVSHDIRQQNCMRSVIFFSAPDIIHFIKSTRMRWVERVVCMWGGERCVMALVRKC